MVGASPRAAIHAGLRVPLLTVAVFALSAALIGLAGAVEVMGVLGNVRADWNPAYGLSVIPLVFLARLNGFAAIIYVLLFSALQIGAESAARRLGVPAYFTLVLVANLLIVLAVVEYVAHSGGGRHGHDPVRRLPDVAGRRDGRYRACPCCWRGWASRFPRRPAC